MKGRGGMRAGAGRKGNWQHGETQTIRVPAALKDELLSLGQQLDCGQGVLGGRMRMELEAVLRDYEAQCDAQGEAEWQPMRELISAVRDVMAQHPRRGQGRRGQGRGCGQQQRHGGDAIAQGNGRGQRAGRCGNVEMAVPAVGDAIAVESASL
ncbi:hypothetical protein PN441_08120 [Spirulina major CS-329]|uniref:hypothetical protein n=1 Tax=Spirulina TaxID=1154 RepID=UPI00232FDB97|nr:MULTISPECIES: hypothetical protein [Spirulina]MDB9496595.1 hypothetical protein [Spirulina subsalsa CS-330]MDB9503037.1 hypothetical protein [Spirulina major CS-329]